ncbi:MAG: hypothetical protein WBM35_11370 [Candidatus Electrothrix sp.]
MDIFEFDHDCFNEEHQMAWGEDAYYPGEYTDEYPDSEAVWVDYDKIRRETDLAVLFVITSGDDFAEPPVEEVLAWIPKSLIEIQEDSRILIPEWFAIKENLV